MSFFFFFFLSRGERIFGEHPFELFKTPRVILTWIVARKVGRCDVGDCFGVDANDLDNRKSDVNSPLLLGGGLRQYSNLSSVQFLNHCKNYIFLG